MSFDIVRDGNSYMDHFTYKKGKAFCERVAFKNIAEKYGTPTYIYSKATIDRHCKMLVNAFKDKKNHLNLLPCYAVKANSNLSILNLIFSHGFGADIVSVGELERALKAGVDVNKVLFSGVGKTRDEIAVAIDRKIYAINVESFSELNLIADTAKKRKKIAYVSLRVNPNIDAKTNPKIATGLYETKFGIAEGDLGPIFDFLKRRKADIKLKGLSCHIGSQIIDLTPIRAVAKRMRALFDGVLESGFDVEFLDLGGGVGIKYLEHQEAPSFEDYAQILKEELAGFKKTVAIEPGRVIVGNAGVLLTKLLHIKSTAKKNFYIVDAAMNDLIRPTLYEAEHQILSAERHSGKSRGRYKKVDVVGPICETGDFLGHDVALPDLKPGALMFIRACGAYGASMASNYNSRPRATEVLVSGTKMKVVRKRETIKDLWSHEI